MSNHGSSAHPSLMAYLVITTMFFVLSCGKSVQVERQEKQVGPNANAEALDLGAGIPSICHEVVDQVITADGISGMISMMQKSVIDAVLAQRKICLQCQPRELKRTKCFNVDVGSLETVCRHNEHDVRQPGVDISIVCKSREDKNGAKEVRFDLKPNRIEQVISALPTLAFVLKLQVLPRLAVGSEGLLVASSAFDFAMLHAKAVIQGQDFDPAADFLVGKANLLRALTNKAALTDAQVISLRKAAIKAFGDLSTIAAKSDSIGAQDLVVMTAAIFEQVPELKAYSFALPFLFSDGGEALLPQNLIDALPANVIAEFMQGLLGQAPAVQGAGSTEVIH